MFNIVKEILISDKEIPKTNYEELKAPVSKNTI